MNEQRYNQGMANIFNVLMYVRDMASKLQRIRSDAPSQIVYSASSQPHAGATLEGCMYRTAVGWLTVWATNFCELLECRPAAPKLSIKVIQPSTMPLKALKFTRSS
jgi:hypothetical protein